MDLPLKISDCSISMVEELLGGLADWKGTQDIIRMTFKAITEVLKNQSISISHLNKQLSSLPPTHSPDAATIQDIEDLKSALSEKASKKDLQSALSTKPSIDQLTSKLSSEDFYSEIASIHKSVEKLNEDFTRKLLDLSNTKDLQKLHMDLTQKPSWAEVQEELNKKLDQRALNEMVSKKSFKAELEEAVRYKVDAKDFVSVSARVEQKTDKSYVDSLIEGLGSQLKQGVKENSDKGLEEGLSTLQGIVAGLQKAVKSELESMKRQVTNALNKKVDYGEVENLYEGMKEKAEMKHLEELQEKISKDFKGVLLDFKKDLKTEGKKNSFNSELIARLTEDLSKLKAQMLEVLEDRKKDTLDHAQFLKTATQQIKNEVKDMFASVDEQIHKTRDFVTENFSKKLELAALQNHLKTLNEQKYSKEDFSLFVSTTLTELKHEIASIKDKKNSDSLKPIQEVLKPEKKSSSKSVTHIETHQIPESSVFTTIQSILQDIDALKSEQKANSSFLSNKLGNVLTLQETLQNEQRLKPNSKEVLALIENKANIDDTNRALVEIHKELDGKIDSDAIAAQFSCLQGLAMCNVVGRWQWKSGELKGNSQVPWEVQICNTSPELFLWEKDKTSIIVLNSGVFEVNFGLFYKKKCRVQFYINGEIVMDSGGKNGISRNKVFSELLMVPARARASVSVIDGNGAIGVLEIIKYF